MLLKKERRSKSKMRSLYLLPLLAAVASAGHFTNEWAVTIDGDEAEAHRVATELNCVVKGEEEAKISASSNLSNFLHDLQLLP